jgi:agmatinase
MPDYVLNAALEVLPVAGDKFRLYLPLWGLSTDATQYQVNLLQSFLNGATPDEVLREFPFNKDESRAFLERCVAEQILLPKDESGEPAYPARSWPSPALFQMPRFDSKARPRPAFAFLGVPYDGGTTGVGGARFGPATIRQSGQMIRYVVDRVRFEPAGFYDYAAGHKLLEGIRLADAGDVSVWAGDDPDLLFARVTEAVQEILRAGTIPVVMGGDHSITHSVLKAYLPRKLAVIQLDAHTDLGSQPGGQLHHGTVFAHVLDEMKNVAGLYQVGLRGLGDAAAEVSDPRVLQTGMDAFRRYGAQGFLARLPKELEYYISCDIDVVDPAFAPATGTPVPGGMAPHELKELLRLVCSQRKVIGMDVVEVAMGHTPSDTTASVALEALLAFADGAVQFVRNALADEEVARAQEVQRE